MAGYTHCSQPDGSETKQDFRIECYRKYLSLFVGGHAMSGHRNKETRLSCWWIFDCLLFQ